MPLPARGQGRAFLKAGDMFNLKACSPEPVCFGRACADRTIEADLPTGWEAEEESYTAGWGIGIKFSLFSTKFKLSALLWGRKSFPDTGEPRVERFHIEPLYGTAGDERGASKGEPRDGGVIQETKKTPKR